MSHPVVNCANCGKSHAPQVTTQQAREAEWPTRVNDVLYMLKKLGWGVPDLPAWVEPKGPMTTNETRRHGVPDPPEWVEPKEAA
jgi:hypothetical protein